MSAGPESAMIRTTCPYCGVGCGLTVAADGSIAGDPDHPANFGKLCSKGAALAETLAPTARLVHPTIDGRQASWEEALDRIAAVFGRIIAEHGPDAVALYVSGQFLTEDYYVANKLMKGFIGSANIDTNSRLCMASSVMGHIRAFGEDIVPGCYEDFDTADLVVVVGSNTAWCHPVLYQRLAAAKASRGTRIVVVDPRRTETCDIADLHLALRPGSDVALFAGLLFHLADSGACDSAWTEEHATGFAGALAAARELADSVEGIADLTDLPARDLTLFYDWFGATERTLTLYSQGVNQSSAGTDKVNAILNCHLATGRIGRPGMGPFSLTGQPNAMGGREVGGLATQLAAHMSFAEPADLDRVRRFWGAARLASQPGLKAVELFDAMLDGRVRALWILGTNPADSMPRAERVRAALAACPFVVVSDCWASDTTRLADVVLPAAGWGEKDGTVTNSERRISRQRAFLQPPGEARADWWMLAEVARRMGWGVAFPYRRSSDIFREHAALSAFENDGRVPRLFDIGALAEISDAEYDAMTPVLWPLPRPSHSAAATVRLFGNGSGFLTRDGRARFVPTPFRPPVELREGARWPFLLNTGRVRDQWHTMTRTGRVPRLMGHRTEPLLDIHPADAASLDLENGGLAWVATRHGEAVLRVRLSTAQRRAEVFAPMHWSDRFSSAGPIGRLVSAATDPVSGQPELKATPARVRALATCWRGFLLRRSDIALASEFYWARVPLARGHAFDLAGWEPLPSNLVSERWILDFLDARSGVELISYADPGRGAFRYASLFEGRLEACIFLASGSAFLPVRDYLAEMLGETIDRRGRLALLAGAPPGASSRTEPGPIVCACFSVGLSTLHTAIAEGRLTSVADIGRALRAGTNCGSCLPELRAALQQGSPGGHSLG
jgi:assimilatory nitrate reductase catalytic subunit